MTVRAFDVKPLRGPWHLAPNPYSARYKPGTSQLYERARIGCLPGGAGHGGRDIDADSEDLILRAVWDGTIYRYPWDDFGNHIGLINSDGHEFMYAHLAAVHASDGQTVKADTDLGIMGETGAAFGVHTHGEIRTEPKNWCTAIDPTNWLLAQPAPAPIELEDDVILFKKQSVSTVNCLVAPGVRTLPSVHQLQVLAQVLGARYNVISLPDNHEWFTYKVVDLSKVPA